MSKSNQLVLPTTFGRQGCEVTGDYNTINPNDSDDINTAKFEFWLAERICTVLMKQYPNRNWGVKVAVPNEMLIIICPSVSNESGYHISMKGRAPKELEKRAAKAAGEILERHDITRARNFDSDILEALPRDVRDNVIAADSKPLPFNKTH